VRVTFEATGETADAAYAALHFGGHDFSCGVGPYDDVAYQRMKSDLLRRYERHSMADVVRGLDEHFPREMFSLRHLFLEERRHVLGGVIRAVAQRHEETYRRIWAESRPLVHYLRDVEAPIPEIFRLTAQHVLEGQIAAELPFLLTSRALPPRVIEFCAEARALGLTLDLGFASPAVRQAIQEALDDLDGDASAHRVAAVLALLEGAQGVGFRFGRWDAQNAFFALWRRHPDRRSALHPIAAALGFALADKAAP
jgi:hypothetical protein